MRVLRHSPLLRPLISNKYYYYYSSSPPHHHYRIPSHTPTFRHNSTNTRDGARSSSIEMSSATELGFYSYKPLDKKGNPFDLAELKGKVVLIVNVASKCGFTPQYKGLEKLYADYQDRGLVVLGFPCNQFGSQAPGTGEEEANFCTLTYGVKFPVLGKIEVNGDSAHPLFEFLKKEKPGLLGMKRIKWNFEKFLISRDGKVVDRWASTTSPSSLASRIEEELNKPAPQSPTATEPAPPAVPAPGPSTTVA